MENIKIQLQQKVSRNLKEKLTPSEKFYKESWLAENSKGIKDYLKNKGKYEPRS